MCGVYLVMQVLNEELHNTGQVHDTLAPDSYEGRTLSHIMRSWARGGAQMSCIRRAQHAGQAMPKYEAEIQ
jgi:hypothetical protein